MLAVFYPPFDEPEIEFGSYEEGYLSLHDSGNDRLCIIYFDYDRHTSKVDFTYLSFDGSSPEDSNIQNLIPIKKKDPSYFVFADYLDQVRKNFENKIIEEFANRYDAEIAEKEGEEGFGGRLDDFDYAKDR